LNFDFNIPAWIRSHPLMRDRTPMCFIYGEKDARSRNDTEAVWRALTGPMAGRPEKHKLDVKHEVRGTDLAGAALLGQPGLGVHTTIMNFLKKVMTDRRAIPWTAVQPETNNVGLVNLAPFIR